MRLVRGGVIIKKTVKFGTFSQIGVGEGQKKTKKSQIQIQTFENRWGGGLNFSKMSQLKVTLRPHPKKKNQNT